MLRAPDQQRLAAGVARDDGGGVAVIVLGRCRVVAGDFPALRAGGLVEGRHPRLAVVHERHHHIALGEHGRSAVVPVERVLAEALGEVRLPTDFPREVHRRELAALEVGEHRLAIRDGRGVAAGAIAMLAGLLRAESGLPERLAVPIEGEERVLPIDRRGDVDRLVPDDGRGAALAGERRLPEPAGVGVELHRVGARVGAAVIAGTAPTGPVAVGGEGGGSGDGEGEGNEVHGGSGRRRGAKHSRQGAGLGQATSLGRRTIRCLPDSIEHHPTHESDRLD